MEVVTNLNQFQFHNTCITIGKFDGVHRGHRILLEQLREQKKNGLTSVVFTFSCHPSSLFLQEDVQMLTTLEEKELIIAEYEPDVMFVYPFTKQTVQIPAEQFVEQVLVNQMDCKALIIGTDFCFGKGRAGNIELLKKLSVQYGFKLFICEKLTQDDCLVSSSVIRTNLSKGCVSKANDFLGRPYFFLLSGQDIVIETKDNENQIISKIPEKKVCPPDGTYHGRLYLENTNDWHFGEVTIRSFSMAREIIFKNEEKMGSVIEEGTKRRYFVDIFG